MDDDNAFPRDDTLVTWNNSQAENHKIIEFWFEHELLYDMTDEDDVFDSVNEARQLIDRFRPKDYLFGSSPTWFARQDRICCTYDYVKWYELHEQFRLNFEPKINPTRIEELIGNYGDLLTEIKLEMPYIGSQEWLTKWLKANELDIIWLNDTITEMPKVTEINVFAKANGNDAILWFLDKDKAMMCKLTQPNLQRDLDEDD